jgi:hypothetical protein
VDRKRKREDEEWREKLEEKKAVWQVNDSIWRAGRAAHIQMLPRPGYTGAYDGRMPAPQPSSRPLGYDYDSDPRDLTGEGVWSNGAYYRGGYVPIEEDCEVVAPVSPGVAHFAQLHHACMRCSTRLDLHACSYELASCLKGASGNQICQSGAAMPDRLAPLLATNHLASATVIMFALQNRMCTRSAPTQTGVTEPFLIPLSDSVPVSKHPIILYVC